MTPRVLARGGIGLDLLAPKGLALLALLVPLVVLYILKIERQRRVVASTWLWAAAQRDLIARSPFKRLVAQIPLWIQALAIALFALALARPATRGREIVGDHVAVVVDASASMSALASGRPGEGPTRMDLAKQAAKDAIAALGPGADALILEAGRDARVVSPLERDRRRLEAAIDRIAARDVEGDLGAAVALAVDRLRQLGGSRRILVITDGNLARPGALLGVALPVELVSVGEPVDNAAIVRVDVRSGIDPAVKREQVQAFAVIANYGKAPRDLYVTLRQENASDVLASRRVLVQPGERLPVVLTFHPTPGDYRRGLFVEMAPRDAMPVDDVAYARVPAGEKLPAFLASAAAKPSPWLMRAIVADPMTELRAGTIADLAEPNAAPPDAFVVIEGACPPSPPGLDLLVVNPPPGRCFGTLVGDPIERPVITSWENADPRLRFLTLDGVHVAKARKLEPDGVAQALVRTTLGPIVTDISTPSRTATLVGFDVGESDWPLKASYVLFVRNLLELARTHRAHGATGPARAGEPLRVSVPATATSVEATGPEGEKLEASLRAGLAVVPDLQRVGLYRITWQGPQAGTLVVPANLVSEAESDLRPKPIATDGGTVDPAATAKRPDAHTDWTWLVALAALGFVVFDVWYATRPARATPLARLGAGGDAPRLAGAARPRVPERKTA